MPQPLPNGLQWQPWVVPNGGIDESRSDHELPPNKWTTALDVEPLPAGCRARAGKTKVNTRPTPAIAISNETGTDTRLFSDGTNNYISQGFTGTAVTAANILLGISVRLAKNAGTPTSGVQCAVYTNSSGKPGSAVTGLDFSDFNTVAAATINSASDYGTQYNYIWIRFSAGATSAFLSNGTVYHIVLKSTGGSGANNYKILESTAGNPYGSGTLNYGSDGSSWTTVALADLLFRLYAGGASINGILDYKLSDGVTEVLLLSSGGEVYKEVGGVMQVVSGLDLPLMSASADVHPAMNVGNDIAFISDGVSGHQPKKYFLRSGTEYWANDGILAPVYNPAAAIAAGGTLPNDTYYIDYYYWDDLLQIQSQTRYNGTSTLNAVSAGANHTINITGLPPGSPRAGDRVTHIRISIRPSASGIFRFGGTAECQIPIGQTTASITTLTLGNEPDYDDGIAPNHSIAVVGSNQRFIAGMTAFPYRVYASKVNIVGPYYESFPSLNYRDFGRGDGDYVTALAFIPPATLIVGMKNSVWALDARKFLIADPVLISKNVGIAGNQSFMVIGRSLFFVSDSDRTKGLMGWNGSQVTPLTALDKTFKNLLPDRIKYATCSHLAPGDDRFQWWVLISATGTSQNRVLVYDYALDSFSIYLHSGNVLGAASSGGSISKTKIGGADGFLHDADTGTSDNGTAITGQFTAKRDDYGYPDAVKRIRFIRVEGDSGTDSHLDIRFEPDLDGFASFSAHADFVETSGSYIGTGVLGSFLLGSTSSVLSSRVGVNGACRNSQLTFSSSSRWSLRGYSVGSQITRRRA